MEALKIEWEQERYRFDGLVIRSIYFGGGTPFLLGPKNIEKILSWIPFSKDVEITLEANPENISLEEMKRFAIAGINRVSIGIQSLNDELLPILSRKHSANTAKQAVLDTVGAGIPNISIDLMYDLPNQTIDQWLFTLQEAVKLPITHLSLYNLVFEPHTVYYKKRALLTKQLPSESESAVMYEEAIDVLEKAGFLQYEISAFEKPGYSSRHNVGYWTARPFWGFGPSAFSYWEGRRFQNIPNLNGYYQSLKNNQSPVNYEEELLLEKKQRELLAIRLRLLSGVNMEEFQSRHGVLEEAVFRELTTLCQEGFVKLEQNQICLTKKGVFFYDTVASEII